ncbi:putative endopeptidase p60 isoform X1 [Cinnamomum micranthum f. kanehirae]|uniref:Putative endopeptidase p60 isoform X1 n=1 Tax=Cinnamomum micranthum f. kanehirae TaxID=337451 RepID=A0A443PEJ2_9MAGN|nr:putative endopeptidase p60 isoform X1 [Cinnamomum micranthum f. kanehirae]
MHPNVLNGAKQEPASSIPLFFPNLIHSITMSDPKANRENGNSKKEAVVAKTVGFLVFSGIAISIIKTLLPNSTNRSKCSVSSPPPPPPTTTTSQTQLQEFKKLTSCEKPSSVVPRTIEIEKGDTLWGLSRKYGVPISAIKEANGLTGETIYAGKKMVIP